MIIKIKNPYDSPARKHAIGNGEASWLVHGGIESYEYSPKWSRRVIYAECDYAGDIRYETAIYWQTVENRYLYIPVNLTKPHFRVVTQKWWEVEKGEVAEVGIGSAAGLECKIMKFKYVHHVQAIDHSQTEQSSFYFDTLAYILNDEGKTIEVIKD